MGKTVFNNDLDVRFTDSISKIISDATEKLGYDNHSITVNNMIAGALIFEGLLEEYPEVDSAYNDYITKTGLRVEEDR
jgi:hypothetical protein